uniref:Putative PD-(D/E)XK nuclease superfamily protein n=1 Tax=viral metagenome TaxID=1070528 RepID=A0A6M3LEW0_9ZZZZ
MAARYYKYNGKKLPSVTTITGQLDKPGLTYWAAGCACDFILNEIEENKYTGQEGPPGPRLIDANLLYPIIETARKNFRKVSSQALDIGSAVHNAIEHYLKTGQEPQAPSNQVLSAFLAFLEWLDKWETWETLYTEHTLYADRFAGMTDWIVRLNGKLTLIDFKTSKQPSNNKSYPEWGYQTAAYRSCHEGVEANAILRLDKESGIPSYYDLSSTYEHDVKVFNVLTDLYYLTHKF